MIIEFIYNPKLQLSPPLMKLKFENFEPIQIDETPKKLCNRFEIALNCDVPIIAYRYLY